MTTSQQTQPETQPLDEKTVADYLRDNPDFFQNNASLLATLEIPHTCGTAVSLVEHQVKVLRDQNRQLKRKLMDLVHVARDNQQGCQRAKPWQVVGAGQYAAKPAGLKHECVYEHGFHARNFFSNR